MQPFSHPHSRILHLLWGLIIATVQGKVAIIPRKSSSAEVYHQLEFVLGELKGFFNCDGNGVPYEDLNTDTCKVQYNQYAYIHAIIILLS